MWDGFDHRKFPRVNLRCEIILSSKFIAKPILTETENVGSGGVCVIQVNNLERFSRCKIKLNIDENQEPIECDGKVCWIIPRKNSKSNKTVNYDTGIEFVQIKPKDQKRLNDFLKETISKGFHEIC